jgi:cytochrome c5
LKTHQVFFAACSVFVSLAVVLAQTPDQTLLTNPVYTKECAKCHGKTAGGHTLGGPALKSDKVAAASPDDMRNIITNGKGHMPKYTGKLTADQIDALVQQIQALNKK